MKSDTSVISDQKTDKTGKIGNRGTFEATESLPGFIDRYEIAERAAIMQFDGGLTRREAEQAAMDEFIRNLKQKNTT